MNEDPNDEIDEFDNEGFGRAHKWTRSGRERLYRSHRIISQNACVMYVAKPGDEEQGELDKKPDQELLFWAKPKEEGKTACRASYDERTIYLAHVICLNISTNIHENMHLLGFNHEHNRPDRDEYITIQEQNIKADRLSQYEKVNDTDFGYLYDYVQEFPYDFKSLMHYSSYGGVKSEGLRAYLVVGNPGKVIKKKRNLSFLDRKKLQYFYSCKKVREIIHGYRMNITERNFGVLILYRQEFNEEINKTYQNLLKDWHLNFGRTPSVYTKDDFFPNFYLHLGFSFNSYHHAYEKEEPQIE
ncbi:high choriolytic enzyme 1-like isoform X3 [Dinothrombium tinctorium]|uniref:Metalloendopeptidase n=1 Tax=Dinothrombium tinctorium TaxID=1965070 RepID=A0A443R069_9ACAR|nr:high choriolytic enzyme 1-like isoform X3 [Dinothrombium tinctorium]